MSTINTQAIQPRDTVQFLLTTGTDHLAATSTTATNEFDGQIGTTAAATTFNAADTLLGAGANNVFNLNILQGVSSLPAAVVQNIQTLNLTVANSFNANIASWTGLQTVNLHALNPSQLTFNIGTSIPRLAIDLAAADKTTGITVIGNATVTADLSGHNLNYTGGSGSDAVTIDHLPLGTLDGGSGPNFLVFHGNDTGLASLTSLANSTKNFGTLVLAGSYADGGQLNAAALKGFYTQFDFAGTDVLPSTGPVQGLTINNFQPNMSIEFTASLGAPVNLFGFSQSLPVILDSETSNVTATLFSHVGSDVTIQSLGKAGFVNHLMGEFPSDDTHIVTIRGNADLDLTGARFDGEFEIDASGFTGNLTIELSNSEQTVFMGQRTGMITIANQPSLGEIDFRATGTKVTNAPGIALGAAVTPADTSTLDNFLNQGMQAGKGHVSWFQFQGNTYLMEDVTGNAAFVHGADAVVKFIGLHDFSHSSIGGNDGQTFAFGF